MRILAKSPSGVEMRPSDMVPCKAGSAQNSNCTLRVGPSVCVYVSTAAAAVLLPLFFFLLSLPLSPSLAHTHTPNHIGPPGAWLAGEDFRRQTLTRAKFGWKIWRAKSGRSSQKEQRRSLDEAEAEAEAQAEAQRRQQRGENKSAGQHRASGVRFRLIESR